LDGRSTELLAQFLRAEIDIGFTFCETAQIEGQLMKDAEGRRIALHDVRPRQPKPYGALSSGFPKRSGSAWPHVWMNWNS
jgi:hypothetical protein